MKRLALLLCLVPALRGYGEEPKDRAAALKLGATIVESDQKGVYTVEWLPEDLDKHPADSVRVIVLLHGTKGSAETGIPIWHPYATKRGVAIVAIQWWLGEDRYLPPADSYAILETRLAALHKAHPALAAKGHMLQGFSRGSANVPGFALLDHDKGLYSLFVCNSGAWPEEKPPPYVRAAKDDAFKGQRFVGYFGAKDEQFGGPATVIGKALRTFLEKRGGKIEKWFEVADGIHGTFNNDARMMNETLDVWLK